MPTLTDPNQVFALQLSAASAITWTLQQQQTVATPQNVGSATNPQNLDFEGIASALGITSIGAPGISGFTLEATYISLINTGAEAQVVTYGKVILPRTYFQVSPNFTLAPGWSAIFVKDSGWTTYDENGVIQGGGSGGGPSASTYSASVYLNASQSVPSSSGEMTTAVAYDTVLFDPAGMFNATTHAFTAPVAGLYLVTATVAWFPDTTDTGGNRGAAFRVNGTSPPLYGLSAAASANTGQSGGGQVVTNNLSFMLELNAGDTVAVVCEPYTSDASAVTIIGANVAPEAQYFTMFAIALLG